MELFHEILIYSVMFNLTYLTTCVMIYYSYGILSDIGSEILIGLFSAMTIGTFIYFGIAPENFYRFRFSFRETTITFYHYFLHALCIISSILLLGLLPNYSWAPFTPQGLMLFYTLFMHPYKKTQDNIRSAFNILVMCVATSLRVYAFYID